MSAFRHDALLAAAFALTSLAGSEWGPFGGGDQFIQFGAEGKVSGHSGCNRYFGPYQTSGKRLRLGPLASTKMACDPEHNALEQRWFRTLDRTRYYEATHLLLILKDGQRRVIAKLRRRDAD
jgi:heat shock protein HslJ